MPSVFPMYLYLIFDILTNEKKDIETKEIEYIIDKKSMTIEEILLLFSRFF